MTWFPDHATLMTEGLLFINRRTDNLLFPALFHDLGTTPMQAIRSEAHTRLCDLCVLLRLILRPPLRLR